MRELYTSKVFPKPPCLIAKIRLGYLYTEQHYKQSPTLGVESTVSITVQIFPILFLQSNKEAWAVL